MHYKRRMNYGGSVDRLKMAFGGQLGFATHSNPGLKIASLGNNMQRFDEGGPIENEGDPKKTPVSPYNPVTQETITANFRNNEGMQDAQSPGKIDAYNFQLPASGSLDDLDDDMKQTLINSDFGKDYLSGEGSLDEKYNKYATKVVGFMKRNPDQALSAINQMIESGNENFQGLKGKSDAEKLAAATRYMTDKKIGDFHGALTLGEMAVPKVSYYTPKTSITRSEVGKGPTERPGIMVSVGSRAVKGEQVTDLLRQAEAEGIDLTGNASGMPDPDAVAFLNKFMDQNGSQERGPEYQDDGGASQDGMYYGAADQYFIDADERAAREQLQRAEQTQKAKQQNRPRYDSRGRLIRDEMAGGGMIYMGEGGRTMPLKAEVSDEMREEAARTVDTSSPFRVRHRGYNDDGKKTYDISYSPLRNALLRRNQKVRASF
jgi:hypothetical protein